jgi:hypothetical protein
LDDADEERYPTYGTQDYLAPEIQDAAWAKENTNLPDAVAEPELLTRVDVPYAARPPPPPE